ncbi:MAG: gliding motility protein GldN [Muribaculaceae bacterium]|nr:gliding motility protein GldN [Muribaculaceae bacterium]
MKYIKRYIMVVATAVAATFALSAQDTSTSTIRRGSQRQRGAQTTTATDVSSRMQNRLASGVASDADLAWMRVIYRELDLRKDENAPLYFPEEPVNGQENMFRLIMRLLAEDKLPAYEYLDGREEFSDKYRLKVKDVLERFHIYHTEAKGSTEKHPKFEIHESDIPANEILSYYIVERWEFDKRSNRTRTVVEAICPVLHRSDEWGMEPVRYPMFWLQFSDLRPYLSGQNIFTTDDNNLATCTYDDFFQLGLYKGDIYKTRNLRNRSLVQMYPDADERRHAQDSIQASLEKFGDKLWVPSLDDLQKQGNKKAKAADGAEATASADAGEATDEQSGKEEKKRVTSKRGSKKASTAKPAKVKKAKAPKSSSSGGAARSVRNRRR